MYYAVIINYWSYFLPEGIKIPKLNRWSMELADYNIMFVHIKGKNNVLVDAISMLKILNIYKELLENPKKTQVFSSTQAIVMEINVTSMLTISISMLHTEQKWDKTGRKLVSQICHGNKSSFKSVIYVCKCCPTETPICSWFTTWHSNSTTFISTNYPA